MTLKCQNHPNAPAVDNCARCNIALCGMCASYEKDVVLCESCAEVWEAEQTVAIETQKLEAEKRKQAAAKVEIERDEPVAQVSVRRKQLNPQTFPLVVTIVCVAIIVIRQLFFTAPDFVPLDDATRIQQLRITSFQECIRVFEEIGRVLARGRQPPDNLRCDGSGQGNIVLEVGGDIVVEHPQPDFYGYTRIYVSRNSPEPTALQ